MWEKILTWGTITLLWWLTLPIFWIQALLYFAFIYWIICLMDLIFWRFAARKQKKVCSSVWIEGMLKKTWIFILFLLSILIVWATQYVFWANISIFIGYIPLSIIIIFSVLEILSIFESVSILYKWSKQGRIFQLLNYLSEKIFNLGVDKLQEIWEKKINKKFEEKFGK